jgi:heat shock protein beta
LLNIICLGCFLLFSCTSNTMHVYAEESVGAAASIMDGFTPEMEAEISTKKESFEFQAEVSRLMDIIINSLYKNRDVFLRELISNASDALDKLRFLAVSNKELMEDNKSMDIKISFNEELKTLTIKDSGIGMTRTELVNNLGTLAKSGTKKFMDALGEGADMGLIGQFGVGFYSVYLVADKVRVITKNPEDVQYIWESTAESSFTVATDPRGNTLGRGTEITMFLKEDAFEYLSQGRIEEIVKKHSEFITFPISLYKKTTEVVEVVEEEKEPVVNEDGFEVEEEEEEKAAPKTEKVDKWDWEVLNGDVAIWARDSKEISDEEYQAFYKVISKDQSDAQTWIHFKAEGEIEFKSIIYIPSSAGDTYEKYNDLKAGVRLYVKKVLIADDFEDLLPKYLNFIKGVADSDDLPLNVSRETLQTHKILKVMSKKLVRKVLEMLRKLSTGKQVSKESDDGEEEEEKAVEDASHPYIKFWEQFGKSIKMGCIEDAANRSKLAKLLRFKSSKSGEGYTSLDSYTEKKPEWQKGIYYIAAETLEAAKKSPFVEVALRKGIEVLYLSDPVDEYVMQNLGDFDGLKFQSLTKDGLKFGDENEVDLKAKSKAYKEAFKPLTAYLADLLKGKVNKVSVSQRVDTTPSIITTGQYGHTANMERIMRAQTFADPQAYKSMMAQKTLEVNPRHPLVAELNRLVASDPDSQSTKDLAHILYDTALMTSGFTHDETDDFSARMYRTLATILKVESMDLLPEVEIPVEEEVVEVDEDEEEEEIGNDEF